MEKKLLFKYPEITSWTWTAATFAILENYENAIPWLYNNFVQLFCERYDNWVSVHYLPHLDVISNNPFFHSALISRELISNLHIDIIDFIKKCIDLKYYVYCKVDEGCICVDRKFLHELVIFGYDDSKETFEIADFTLNKYRKYTLASTSFQNIKKAYENVMHEEDDMTDGIGGDGGIFIFAVNEGYYHKFNINLLLSQLEDYINCKDQGKDYRTKNIYQESNFSKGLKGVSLGIDVYDEIIKYYRRVQHGNNRFYIQPLHVLYDHKVLMISRLQYIKDKIDISNEIIEQYIELKRKTEITRNLGVKYWINPNVNIINEIIDNLEIIREKDNACAAKLLFEMKNFLKNKDEE